MWNFSRENNSQNTAQHNTQRTKQYQQQARTRFSSYHLHTHATHTRTRTFHFFIHPFVHSFIHSYVHTFVCSFTHFLTKSMCKRAKFWGKQAVNNFNSMFAIVLTVFPLVLQNSNYCALHKITQTYYQCNNHSDQFTPLCAVICVLHNKGEKLRAANWLLTEKVWTIASAQMWIKWRQKCFGA